jgi:hypothetical protein
MMNEAEIVAALFDEITSKTLPMELLLSALSVLQLAGVIQLALRHPDLDGGPRDTAERFLAAVRTYFGDSPTALEVLRRGDLPEFDMPPRRGSH